MKTNKAVIIKSLLYPTLYRLIDNNKSILLTEKDLKNMGLKEEF